MILGRNVADKICNKILCNKCHWASLL